MTTDPLRVCHVITGLETGGAELMLAKLLAARGAGDADSVVSLRDAGPVATRLEDLGVPVAAIGLGRGVPAAAQWRALRLAVAAHRPDVVVGWMYHGNLAASMAAAGRPVVWGIRQSFGGYRRERPGTRAAIWLGARWSRRPAGIIYNSRTSVAQHQAIGYSPRRVRVVPNGFDLTRFRPDPLARARLGQQLDIGPDSLLVGNIARFHPMKNHRALIAAVIRARATGSDISLVLAGRHVDWDNPELVAAGQVLRRSNALHLLGERGDVDAIMPGLDLYCSPSAWGEGFPNAVGEAAASGVPSVVTDIGDSAWVIGKTGEVLARSDAAALSASLLHWASMAGATRRAAGAAARERIASMFDLPVVANQFYQCLHEFAASPPQLDGEHDA